MADDLLQHPAPPPSSKWPPPVTLVIIVVCCAIFAVLNYAPAPTILAVSAVVMPTSTQVWHGAVWGLVTSAFVHLAVWHLAFNMWWARDLGRLMEPKVGAGAFVAFVIAAAAVSSGWQVLVSNAAGIGFSGVVYALFGYVAARRKSDPDYGAFVTPKTTRWLLGWLVLCIGLTVAKIWNVGNAAHVSGLVFGFLVGTVAERRASQRSAAPASAGLVLVGIGAVLACAYMPWSEHWQARHALRDAEKTANRAAEGDPAAQAATGAWYIRFPEHRAAGVELLQKSAEAGNVVGMNGLAWVRATCTDETLRNGAEAVRWAQKAVAQAPGDPSLEDTLAAAYAESGRWAEALEAQRPAIARLPAAPEQAQLRKTFEEHLARIERLEPIRD